MSVRGEIEGDVMSSMQELVMADRARLDEGWRLQWVAFGGGLVLAMCSNSMMMLVRAAIPC